MSKPVGYALITRFLNPDREGSWLDRRRRARALADLDYLLSVQASCGQTAFSVLDVGGTVAWWRLALESRETPGLTITLLNVEPAELSPGESFGVFKSESGDGCDLSEHPSGSFDFVYSNSVIEHAGSFMRRAQMAAEISRLGRYGYLVQAPSHGFPLDPHSGLPLFHRLPTRWRAALIGRFTIRYYPGSDDRHENLVVADSTLMPTYNEMCSLFPEAEVEVERLLGMSKSFTAVHRKTSVQQG